MNYENTKEWHIAYNYMVMTLTHAATALKNGNCNEHGVTMYEATCSKLILDWYGLTVR